MPTSVKRTIILPIDKDNYNELVNNRKNYRKKIDELIEQYPELFPPQIIKGYRLVGYSNNVLKSPIKRRMIRIKHPFNNYEDYLLHPCFLMPYQRGWTVQVSDGLLLRKNNTPYHAIASVLGQNSMYWYRAELTLAQYNIAGTTVKRASKLPYNLLIDEHHSRLGKDKIYICTTVGDYCFLGAHISPTAQYDDLKLAYGKFKEEVQLIAPQYSPSSINMDGFLSTKKAAKYLYPQAALLRCFLHAFLKIRNCGSKAYDIYFNQIARKVWHCYDAPDKRTFSLRIWELENWTKLIVPSSPFKKAILQLCKKKGIFNPL